MTINKTKMKILKQSFTAVSLVLVISFAAMITCACTAQAQTVPNINIKNWAYVDLEPSKVGTGQTVTVIYGIDHVSPLASTYSDLFSSSNFKITITKPDGTLETRSDLYVDATSFGHFTYMPVATGNYSFVLNFAGQWWNLTAGTFAGLGILPFDVNYYYEPATSPTMILTVQDEPVSGTPVVPLPSDFWTTPVYSENKNWAVMLDNWLMPAYDHMPRSFAGQGAFSPYSIGPNSAHILWTSQLQTGGLVGGQFGSKSYFPSEVYEQYYTPMILNGRIYYTDHGPSTSNDIYGTRVLDLYTGEEVNYMTNVMITNIQTFDYETPNKHGIVPYLWDIPSSFGTEGINTHNPCGNPFNPPLTDTWKLYDAYTGTYICSIANASNIGFPVYGPNGELLIYNLAPDGSWMSMWNSTKCWVANPTGTSAGFSPTVGEVLDWQLGLEWNVTLNAPSAIGSPGIGAISLTDNKVLVLYDNRLFYPVGQLTYPAVLTDCAYPATIQGNVTSIDPLWVQNRTNIYDYVEPEYFINEGMYSLYDDAEQKVHTYDVNTGAELSISDSLSPNAGTLYTTFSHTLNAYGNTYVWGYDGYMRCVDGKTGDIEWATYLGAVPYGQAYSNVPVYQGPTIADGKVYVGGSDHTPDSDMWTGSKMWCLNASTGACIWNITGYYGYSSLSNGYLTAYNGYDVKIYTFGKGPSATTVTAPNTEITMGQSLVIRGTVTDQSPGQKGTACVSDDSMGAWMEYLHMQKPMPTNATGVTVYIDVLDSNGNYRNIGTTTSDTSGTFGFAWAPDIPGLYKVVTRFAGSESYGSSYAETYFNVVEAPQATPTATPVAQAPVETYFTVSTIAIIIAIVIVGVLMLRKRP
jgi:hypothetical protein